MKVSIDWLKELVDLKVSIDELVELLPLRSIGTKEVTDRFIELDMKGYNRSDLLSMRGVAYEVAAITDSKVTFEEIDTEAKEQGDIKVVIENNQDCPIYCVARIDGLKVAKSDPKLVQRLADCGVREVNNIADVTNLVMLEYGQPLHTFDSQIVGETISVRKAKNGEQTETLDAKKRVLSDKDIVICSDNEVIGIAGVMGSKNSEITEKTTSIVLEAAIFDPKMLRQTANRLNIHSEAAKRFYHGLTQKRLMQAFAKAISLYQDMGGTVSAMKITGSYPQEQIKISIEPDKIRELIGVDLEDSFIESALKKLYFGVENNNGKMMVKPPYFRLDCRMGVDLIEEVARMYGYEKIPAKALEGEVPVGGDQSNFEYEARLREELVKIGFNEVLTYSFVSSELIEVMGMKTEEMIRVANPISKETEYMRTNIWPNLVEKAIENLKYRKNVRMFEIGKVYKAAEGLVKEQKVLSLIWADGGEDPLKGLTGVISQLSTQVSKNWQFNESQDLANLHPVRQVQINDGEDVGIGGEVDREVVDKLAGNLRLAVVEIKI